MRIFLGLATALAVLAAPACDGDSGGTNTATSGGISITGATSATTIADVSAAQLTELCTEANAYQSSFVSADLQKRGGCTLVALMFSSDKASCEATVTSCMAEPAEPTSGADCSTVLADRPPSCNATIAQVQACLGAQGAALAVQLGAASCNDAGKTTGGGDEAMPAACQTVDTACPGFFGGS